MANVWERFTNQLQWKKYLQNLLRANNKALFRSIVLVYDMQTDEEKGLCESVEDNRVGFGKVDAVDLSIIARKLKQGWELTPGEIACARNKMPKYWKQLMVISKKNMQVQKVKDIDKEMLEELQAQQEVDEPPLDGEQMTMNMEDLI